MRSEMVVASLFFAAIAQAAGAAPELPQPKLPPPPAWRAPTPAASTVNGTRVVVLPQRNLPLVHVVVTVHAGSSLDPADKPGLASLTARMLEEGGAGGRSGAEVSAAIEELGGELHRTVDEDGVELSLTVLSTKLDRALGLIADMLARPKFDATEWPNVRARQVADILHLLDRPQNVASVVFMKALYGDHPYGHSPFGTKTVVEKLTLEDVQGFYKAHYGPKAATVILVGDATMDGATKAVQSAFGGWTSAVTPPPAPRVATAPTSTRLVLVDRPGAPQSALHVGRLGSAASSPDVAALELLEMVMGGSFTSRLTQNLREKHGYTYGARDHFRLLRSVGPYAITTAVRTDVTAESLTEIFKELAGIRQPLPAEDFKKGRALVSQRVVETFGQGDQLAFALSDLVMGDRGLDAYPRLQSDLDRLTAADVTKVADRQLPSEAWIVVVVGDRKVVEPKLRALPFGKNLEVRDAEGNVVK